MTRLVDVIKPRRKIEGAKADYRTQVKDREIEFTDWGPFTNEYGPGYIFQFYEGGVPYVFITHSRRLKEQVLEWEEAKGREPFTATVKEKKTSDGKTAYIFT